MTLPAPTSRSACMVTGASAGIGAAIARELARRGQNLVLVARRAQRLQELAAELASAHGVRVETLAFDLGDAAARAEMVGAAADLDLDVDVLVNNAGYGSGGRFQELEVEREVGMVRINVEAVVSLCGAYLPGMVQRRRGGILNVASTTAFQPLASHATYSASKAFVLWWTESLHQDLAGTGVTATALCPGPVKTEFAGVAGLEEAEGRTPGIFWTDVEKVAEEGVRGFDGGKRVVVPGVVNRVGALYGQHAPRSVLLRLSRFTAAT